MQEQMLIFTGRSRIWWTTRRNWNRRRKGKYRYFRMKDGKAKMLLWIVRFCVIRKNFGVYTSFTLCKAVTMWNLMDWSNVHVLDYRCLFCKREIKGIREFKVQSGAEGQRSVHLSLSIYAIFSLLFTLHPKYTNLWFFLKIQHGRDQLVKQVKQDKMEWSEQKYDVLNFVFD